MKSKNKKPSKKSKISTKTLLKSWPLMLMVLVSCTFLGATKYSLNQVEAEVYNPTPAYVPNVDLAKQDQVVKVNDNGIKNQVDVTNQPAADKPVEPSTPQPPTATTEPKKVSVSPSPVAPNSPPSPPPAAPAPPPPSSGLETGSSLSYINSLRSEVGKSSLTQNAVMNQWALTHAIRLASECTLYHQNLNSFLGQNIGPKNVMSIAENVGYASTTAQVLDGLKNSAGHYANMTGDYTYVGLAVVPGKGSCAGYVYTTQMFAK